MDKDERSRISRSRRKLPKLTSHQAPPLRQRPDVARGPRSLRGPGGDRPHALLQLDPNPEAAPKLREAAHDIVLGLLRAKTTSGLAGRAQRAPLARPLLLHEPRRGTGVCAARGLFCTHIAQPLALQRRRFQRFSEDAQMQSAARVESDALRGGLRTARLVARLQWFRNTLFEAVHGPRRFRAAPGPLRLRRVDGPRRLVLRAFLGNAPKAAEDAAKARCLARKGLGATP
mmetsp:Transcript_19518/g.69362  ORF Transcript_19518/g.69362 Transcript_19518/m.69362 type:complete len:230 (+) Transcript_19518:464-1153(+)